METEPKYITLTPTWSGLLPALLALYVDGNAQGRKYALEELQRLAAIADRAVSNEERAQ